MRLFVKIEWRAVVSWTVESLVGATIRDPTFSGQGCVVIATAAKQEPVRTGAQVNTFRLDAIPHEHARPELAQSVLARFGADHRDGACSHNAGNPCVSCKVSFRLHQHILKVS